MEPGRGSSLAHNPSLSLPVVVQLLSRIQFFASPWTACQAPLSSTIFLSLLKFRSIESMNLNESMMNLMQSKHLILCHLLLVPSIFASIRVFFQWVSSSHQVAKVLELQLQQQSGVNCLSHWLMWFPCSPRDSQKSSPTPQFETINSLVLGLLCGPTLRSMHDYQKNHSSLPAVCSFLNLEDSCNTQKEVDIQTVGEGADSLCGLCHQLLGFFLWIGGGCKRWGALDKPVGQGTGWSGV